MTYYPPTFHALARAIVYQQLSGKDASTIGGRCASACGVRNLSLKSVLARNEQRMRECELSGQRTRYIRELA